MRQKFKLKGKDETTTTITVEVISGRYVLTREEQKRYKVKLQNAIHDVLRSSGYDVNQIRQVR